MGKSFYFESDIVWMYDYCQLHIFKILCNIIKGIRIAIPNLIVNILDNNSYFQFGGIFHSTHSYKRYYKNAFSYNKYYLRYESIYRNSGTSSTKRFYDNEIPTQEMYSHIIYFKHLHTIYKNRNHTTTFTIQSLKQVSLIFGPKLENGDNM